MSIATVEKVQVVCKFCQVSRDSKPMKGGGAKLPRNWKRAVQGDGVVCDKCWRARYMLRAISLPVSGPIEAEWKDLREALTKAWSQTTSLANWCANEFYARDVRRTPDMEKLPAWKVPYLYPDATARFPEAPTSVVVSVEHAMSGKYRAKRYEVVWLSNAALPTARYPQPLPIRSQDWSAKFVEDNVPIVVCPIARQRFKLRLRGGSRYRRQLAAFRQLAEGRAVAADLVLYRQRANPSDHRNGVEARDDSNRMVSYRVMAKLVMWLPKPEVPQTASGTLFVRTSADSLLLALDSKDERLWIENCDQVRRWCAEHRRRLNRWSDDTKAEQRPRPSFASRREAAVVKHRRRLDSVTHEVVSHVINFARRRNFAAISYDDSERSFVPEFPWHLLKQKLMTKCDEFGLEFVYATKEKTPEEASNAEVEAGGEDA